MNSLVVHGLGLHASNAGGSGLIPGQETKIPHAIEQLSFLATTTEPETPGVLKPQLGSPCAATERSYMMRLRPDAAK